MVDNQIDRQAEARANLGLERLLQQPRSNEAPPHPSRGGSQGYVVPQRQGELADAGLPTRASDRSHRRWRQDIIPRRMTGNKGKDALVGPALLYALRDAAFSSLSFCFAFQYSDLETEDAKQQYCCPKACESERDRSRAWHQQHQEQCLWFHSPKHKDCPV
jgi:hypothetical protein